MIVKIFKYEIPLQEETIEIQVPCNAILCDIEAKGNKIYMWLEVELGDAEKTMYIKIFGTGEKILNASDYKFLKTVHMDNGLVWHVFELITW